MTIRLLDPPLHEFLPQEGPAMAALCRQLAGELGASVERVEARLNGLREVGAVGGCRGWMGGWVGGCRGWGFCGAGGGVGAVGLRGCRGVVAGWGLWRAGGCGKPGDVWGWGLCGRMR